MAHVTNPESDWRLALTESIAPAYVANAGVVAVFSFGSASYEFADRYSDVEVGIVWSQPPEEAELNETACRVKASDRSVKYMESKQAWSEEYRIHGVKIETGHWTCDTIETIIADVVERFDVVQNGLMFEKQATVAALQRAIVFHGEERTAEWRERAARYPDGLAAAMVEANLKFGSFGSREMLAERSEIPLLYEHHCRLVRLVVNILFGLNRIYYPSFKWTCRFIEEMTVKPPDLFARIERVFQTDAHRGARELRTLIEETFDLIERNLPQIDLKPHREEFAAPYPIWHKPVMRLDGYQSGSANLVSDRI